jgi:hypothetical protein
MKWAYATAPADNSTHGVMADPRDVPLTVSFNAADHDRVAAARHHLNRRKQDATHMNLLEQFSPEQAMRLMHLQHEIALLGDAKACITEGASTDVVYGRINQLQEDRRDQMVVVIQQAQGQALAQLNDRA